MAEDPKITQMKPGEVGGDNQSLADALDDSWMAQVVKEHKEETAAAPELHMGFPSWGDPTFPTLVVTFGVLDKKRVEHFQREARKAQRKGESSVNADILFLCEAARKVWLRRPDNEQLIQVKKGDQPVRLDKNLGEMLKLDDEHNATQLARMMYLADRNEVALGAWAVTVAQWMTNTSATVANQVLEEVLVKG